MAIFLDSSPPVNPMDRTDDSTPLGVKLLIHALTEVTYPQERYEELDLVRQRAIRRRAIFAWRIGIAPVTRFARAKATVKVKSLLATTFTPAFPDDLLEQLAGVYASVAIDTFCGAVIADNQPLDEGEARS